MATSTQQTIRELRQEIKSLSAELEKQTKRATTNGNGTLSHLHITRDDIRELAENAGETARAYLVTKREQGREMMENAAHRYEDSVSSHPWKATALAALSGAALATLLFRRR